jgi:hypothetical protein
VAGAAQPVALLLDLPEPIWRQRLLPKRHEEYGGLSGTTIYELSQKPWLELFEERSGNPISSFLVRTAGGFRTLVGIAPGPQSRKLDLRVRRHLHKLYDGIDDEENLELGTITLSTPPWEETI